MLLKVIQSRRNRCSSCFLSLLVGESVPILFVNRRRSFLPFEGRVHGIDRGHFNITRVVEKFPKRYRGAIPLRGSRM